MIYKKSVYDLVLFTLPSLIRKEFTCIPLAICMIYPNGLTLRPLYIPDNICGKIVKGLYKTDTSTNVFPVFMYTIRLLYIALAKCEALKNKPAVRYASLVLLHFNLHVNYILKAALCLRCYRRICSNGCYVCIYLCYRL